MICPVCKDASLMLSERQGIEIDYCPQCRGVWLDRGELDKIIERTAGDSLPKAQFDDRNRRSDYPQHGYKKKKESFLGDLFDF